MAIDLGYDEGGVGSTLLVSMQLAKVERAKKFKKIWKRKLGTTAYFHAKEFRTMGQGVFANLSWDERIKLLDNLSALINRHISIGMTVRVDVDFYNSLTTQSFRSRWGTAYTFAINILGLGAYVYCNHFGLSHDVNVLIEDGHPNSGQALQVMQDLKKAGPSDAWLHVLTCRLGLKKDHPILQAADMLVHSEWQNIRGGYREMYERIHVYDSPYQPEMITIDKDLIESVTQGAANWIEKRKEFGRKKYAARINGIPDFRRHDEPSRGPETAPED